MRTVVSSLILFALSLPAFAVDDGSAPEPGSLALMGIAAVAGIAVALRKKK